LTGGSSPVAYALAADTSAHVFVGGDFYFAGGTASPFVAKANHLYTPLQSWKLTHLGDANAPDLDDPDGDGLQTLAEYGLSLLPETTSQLPGASIFTYTEGDRLRMFVPRDPAHNDITVSVEASSDLVAWTALATSILGAPFAGPGYVGGDDAMPGRKTLKCATRLTSPMPRNVSCA